MLADMRSDKTESAVQLFNKTNGQTTETKEKWHKKHRWWNIKVYSQRMKMQVKIWWTFMFEALVISDRLFFFFSGKPGTCLWWARPPNNTHSTLLPSLLDCHAQLFQEHNKEGRTTQWPVKLTINLFSVCLCLWDYKKPKELKEPNQPYKTTAPAIQEGVRALSWKGHAFIDEAIGGRETSRENLGREEHREACGTQDGWGPSQLL